jgi:LysR family hydrogen peroxide-inducible transcriptional activator
VTIFERHRHEVTVTSLGETIIEQAQRVLEQAETIELIAKKGKDQLSGELRVGVIYTVDPYLLPRLIPIINKLAPQFSLIY